jgi:hypothetical protein
MYPIEVLPSIFRYGYGMPFYNISHASRCIVFGTKNTGRSVSSVSERFLAEPSDPSCREFRSPYWMDCDIVHHAAAYSVVCEEKGRTGDAVADAEGSWADGSYGGCWDASTFTRCAERMSAGNGVFEMALNLWRMKSIESCVDNFPQPYYQ